MKRLCRSKGSLMMHFFSYLWLWCQDTIKELCFLMELHWILQVSAWFLFMVFLSKKQDLRTMSHLKRIWNRPFHRDLKNRIPETHGYFISSPHLLELNFWPLLKDPPSLREAKQQKRFPRVTLKSTLRRKCLITKVCTYDKNPRLKKVGWLFHSSLWKSF